MRSPAVFVVGVVILVWGLVLVMNANYRWEPGFRVLPPRRDTSGEERPGPSISERQARRSALAGLSLILVGLVIVVVWGLVAS